MTNKLFIGIIPLLTACTIDLEMQLEVGLKDNAEDLENLEEFIMEEASELLEQSTDTEDLENSDVIVDDTSTTSCEVDLLEVHDIDGDHIFVEWEIHGIPQAETVIALLHGEDILHLDFLPMEENIYELQRPEEGGVYDVYVGSGADLQNPDCFAMSSIEIEDVNSDIEMEVEDNSCETFNDVRSLDSAQIGDSLFLEWDVDTFAGEEDVEVMMYDKDDQRREMFFSDITPNIGVYELVVAEDIPLGDYGVSLVSKHFSTCIHYDFAVEQQF